MSIDRVYWSKVPEAIYNLVAFEGWTPLANYADALGPGGLEQMSAVVNNFALRPHTSRMEAELKEAIQVVLHPRWNVEDMKMAVDDDHVAHVVLMTSGEDAPRVVQSQDDHDKERR